MKSIDVIIAHYNGSAYIGTQMESIQKNVLPVDTDLKIIVIDDNSRAEEFQHLIQICSPWKNVTIVRNETNLGVIKTFERGLIQSKANYIMLCDQDDVWLPNKIARSLAKIESKEPDVPAMVFTNLTTVDRDLKVITQRMLTSKEFRLAEEKWPLLFQNVVAGCTIIANRKLLDLALPFPVDIKMHDHWMVVCAAFSGELDYITEPTMLYRQHSANLVGQPQRQLLVRLRKPFQTLSQFNHGLLQKSRQAQELSNRLTDPEVRFRTAQVSRAFKRRSPKQLKILLRGNVFFANWLQVVLICLIYLLTPRRRDFHATK
jgi:glycosyltransferase involved in cell wall biosynthesis